MRDQMLSKLPTLSTFAVNNLLWLAVTIMDDAQLQALTQLYARLDPHGVQDPHRV